ncbi:MAG: hypothetical protein H6R26_178 [Proteobacteria bacterium]|nr:hypothetical protein [Pseudomonadota bacterium]
MNEKRGFMLVAVFLGFVAFSGQSEGVAEPATRVSIPHEAESTLCPSNDDARGALARLRTDIAKAQTIDEARTLALAPTDAALDAVSKARSVVPFSQDLRQAQSRLADARSRIEEAETPAQVADEFSGMMWAGLDDDSLARVKVGSHGCDYSTGETIAIVVGLILGIVPGLILLVVLC